VHPHNLPGCSADLHARVCWLHPRPLQAGRKYFLKHMSQTVQAVVTTIQSRLDVTTLEEEPGASELAMNDLGEIRLRTSKPLVFDGYAGNRLTGSFILIEQGTNATVAAGMLFPPAEIARPEYRDFAI
jgi:sulfate adenylyltransferase subunit 1 (EFTu-like GTPase family)